MRIDSINKKPKNLLRILLIRHGQTEWNRVERFRGRVDLDLNEQGKKQATLLANKINNDGYNIKYIITSPLKRAQQTANILAEYNHFSVRVEEGLIDINYGDWQGLSPEEANERFPELYSLWLNEPQTLRFPHGEGLNDVCQRATQVIKQLINESNNTTLVMVSHKVVCKVLMCYFMGLELNNFWRVEQDVCALNHIEVEGSLFRVRLVNDICHLKLINQ